MFYPLIDDIWIDSEMNGCVDMSMNSMDEWREDIT